MQARYAQGMAWFLEDDYEAFKSVLPDRRWHLSFREWEAAAQQAIQRAEDQGIVTIKAQVRSTDFVAWCRSTGRNIDTHALTAWAAEVAHRQISNQN